jgi:hypothetical protein
VFSVVGSSQRPRTRNINNLLCRMPTSKTVNIDVMYCWLWPRQMTDPYSRQRGRPISTKQQLTDSNNNLVLGPRRGLTSRLTGRLTVSRSVILTWLISEFWVKQASPMLMICEAVASQRGQEPLNTETEQSLALKDVPRKRQMKTEQTEKT